MILPVSSQKNSENYFEYQSKGYVNGPDRIISLQLYSIVLQNVFIDWDYDNAGMYTTTSVLAANTLNILSQTFTGGFSGLKKVRVTCSRPSEIYQIVMSSANRFQEAPDLPTNLGYFNGVSLFFAGGSKYTDIDLRPLFMLTRLQLSSSIDYGTNYAGFLPQTASDGSGGIPHLDLRFTPYLSIFRAVACGINTLIFPETDHMTWLNIIGNNIISPINYLSSSLTNLYVARSSLNSTKLPLHTLPVSLEVLGLGTGARSIIASIGAVNNSYPACDLSHLTNLISCWVDNCSVTSLTLPSTGTMTDLRLFNNAVGNINAELAKVPNLEFLYIGREGGNTMSNNIGALDLSAHSSLLSLDIGQQGVTSVILPSGNAMTILIARSNTITDFNHLSTSLTTLIAFDNQLTSSIIPDISACTALTSLQLGSFNNALGQGGNSLGNDVDLSALSSLTTLDLTLCGLTGTLTLPSSDNMVNLYLDTNSGLTGLNRIPASVTNLRLGETAMTSLPALPAGLVDFRFYDIYGAATFSIDLSSHTTNFSNLYLQNSRLTALTLPSGKNINTFVIHGNATLNSVENLNMCNFPDGATTFYAYQCALDITYPLGAVPNGIKNRNIRIYQNDMSLANVNATIDNLYANRANFNNNAITKTLMIHGAPDIHQARPSGILQMPAGFSYGLSDGTPASQMEQIWVLANQNANGDTNAASTNKKYRWMITVSTAVSIDTLLDDGGDLRIQLSNATTIVRNIGQRITINNSSEVSYNGTWVIVNKVSNADYTLSLAYVTNTATGQSAS